MLKSSVCCPGLEAQVAPAQVDILIAGPIPDLENMTPVDVRVVVDLTGLEPGTYQLEPIVEILPDGIYLQSISPETVEVIIQEQPTPTAVPTPTPIVYWKTNHEKTCRRSSRTTKRG